MSFTDSQTQTYSVADIGKVIDCIAADLDMNAQSTGLLTRELAKSFADDVKLMAQNGYLTAANIVLRDAAGGVLRAAKYEVAIDASTLTAQRPGNNLWPRILGGDLGVVVQLSKKWQDLTDASRTEFNKSLKTTWGASSTDTTFSSLTKSADRSYVSNGWGVTKNVFK